MISTHGPKSTGKTGTTSASIAVLDWTCVLDDTVLREVA